MTNSMQAFLALLLAFLVPLASIAQEGRAGTAGQPLNTAPERGHNQPGEQPEVGSLVPVNPNLLKKKVMVYLRDGRSFQGKLLELYPDTLVLQLEERDPVTRKKVKRTERINRAEMVAIEPHRGRTVELLAAALVGGSLGLVAQKQASGPQAPPPARPDPLAQASRKLRGKEVVVYLKDGRSFRGKLVEVTGDSLQLRMQAGYDQAGKPAYRVETIPLRDVASLERVERPARRLPPWAVVGIALAIILVPVAFVAATID